MKVPTTFDGERSMTSAFIRECRLYMSARKAEFPSERSKIAFVLSYCSGPGVESWVEWVMSMMDTRSIDAPKNVKDLLQYLSAYFGDPDEKMTAKMQLDKLFHKDRIEKYVMEFQSLAWKTGYSDEELEH
jgi:hypothetical protein